MIIFIHRMPYKDLDKHIGFHIGRYKKYILLFFDFDLNIRNMLNMSKIKSLDTTQKFPAMICKEQA